MPDTAHFVFRKRVPCGLFLACLVLQVRHGPTAAQRCGSFARQELAISRTCPPLWWHCEGELVIAGSPCSQAQGGAWWFLGTSQVIYLVQTLQNDMVQFRFLQSGMYGQLVVFFRVSGVRTMGVDFEAFFGSGKGGAHKSHIFNVVDCFNILRYVVVQSGCTMLFAGSSTIL